MLDSLQTSRGVATDISESAVKIATENAKALGMEDRVTFVVW